jgi:hypothetical protein
MPIVPKPDFQFVNNRLLTVGCRNGLLRDVDIDANLPVGCPVFKDFLCKRICHVFKLALAALVIGIE